MQQLLIYSMLMYKYVVNTRGRAVRTDEKKLVGLLSRGFKEISQQDFDRQKYYPQFDNGGKEQGVVPVFEKVAQEDAVIKTRTV